MSWQQWLPNRKWLFLPPILLGILVFALIVSRKKPLPRRDDGEQAVSIPVLKIEASPVALHASGYGTVQPKKKWTAIAEVSGRLVFVHPRLEAGNRVEAEEVLLRIDRKDYELRLAQRKADVDAAQARLAELAANQKSDLETLQIDESMLQVQRKDWNRLNDLFRKGAVSRSELDAAESNLLRQKQSVQLRKNSLSLYPSKIDSAKASLANATSRVEEIRRDLERTVIRAPFAGRLSATTLEKDQFVNAGQTLLEIQDADTVEIESQFGLAELSNLLSGLPAPEKSDSSTWTGESGSRIDQKTSSRLNNLKVQVRVRSGPAQQVYRGKAIRLTESLDPKTRTIGVVIEVENRSRFSFPNGVDSDAKNETNRLPLMPGEFCQVRLIGPTRSMIAVPRNSVDGRQVYLVDEDERLTIAPVTLGPIIGDRVIVVTGLAVGQKMVTAIQLPMIVGQKVKPVEIPPITLTDSPTAKRLQGQEVSIPPFVDEEGGSR